MSELDFRTALNDREAHLLRLLLDQTGWSRNEFLGSAIAHYSLAYLWGTNAQVAREKAAKILTRHRRWTVPLDPAEIQSISYDYAAAIVRVKVRREPQEFHVRMAEWEKQDLGVES